MRILLALLPVTVALVQSPGTFFHPPASVSNQMGFQSDIVWTVGETQSIQWTTTYSDYTIELWQQVLGQGAALVGPSIFQTQTGAVTQFNRLVHTFQFDLTSSNVFFLWLVPGANEQGSGSSFTSHYFNITAAPTSISPTSSSFSTSSSSTSSSLPTASPSTTIPSSSTTPGSSPATSTSTDVKHSSGLTTVVKVGIGIGAVIGIFVVAALGALTMWYLERRRRSQSTKRQVQAAQTSKNPKIVQVEALPLDYYPVEADGVRHPAELG